MRNTLLFLAVLTIGLFLAAPMNSPAAEEAEQRFDVPVGNSPALGPADAPVTMIEFLDYT